MRSTAWIILDYNRTGHILSINVNYSNGFIDVENACLCLKFVHRILTLNAHTEVLKDITFVTTLPTDRVSELDFIHTRGIVNIRTFQLNTYNLRNW